MKKRKRSEGEKALDRMFKKGGRAHFSLRRGAVIHVNGERPIQAVQPIEREEQKR